MKTLTLRRDESAAPVALDGILHSADYTEQPAVPDTVGRAQALANKHELPNAYRAPPPTVESAVDRADRLGIDLRFEDGEGMAAEPLFHTARDAVRFAVTRDGSPARPVQSRMVDATDGSRDLAGLDGAAQAGMILNALEGLGKLALAAMIAGCAPATLPCSCRAPCCSGHKINRIWRESIDHISHEAVRVIAEKSERTTKANYALRSAIVLKLYGGKDSIVGIASRCKVDPDTVSKHHRVIRQWLMGAPAWRDKPAVEGVETTAWRDAETVLQNVGIVGGA